MTKENAIHTVSAMRDEIEQALDTLSMFHIHAKPFDRLWAYVTEDINDTLASAGLPSIKFPDAPPIDMDYYLSREHTPHDEWLVTAVANHLRYIRTVINLIDNHIEEVR